MQIRRVAEKFRVIQVVQAGKEGLIRVRTYDEISHNININIIH